MRLVAVATSCPCVWDADWGSRSDGIANSRLLTWALVPVFRYPEMGGDHAYLAPVPLAAGAQAAEPRSADADAEEHAAYYSCVDAEAVDVPIYAARYAP